MPIFLQAYPDEFGKMDFANRRDAFCGKFSIEDMFYQYRIPYTVFPPHVVHPSTDAFQKNLRDFAAVCRIVKRMKRYTIGGIGARTTLFKTVRFDELTLQRYGITYESHDLSELFARMRAMEDGRSAVKDRMERLQQYCNCSKMPADKLLTLAKMSVGIDDMIEEYHFDSVSIRCWNEMHQQFSVAPCVLLSELNDRGIVASCEMDVANTVTMEILSQASQKPAACLDWNNNYGSDENKCILFHCGSTAQGLMEEKGTVGIHKMFAKGNGPDYGWGVNEGRIAATPMTYASARTEDGVLYTYVDEGRITGEPIEKEYFGCAGVAEIDDLQKKMIYMGRNGFRHHTTITAGLYADAMEEAMKTYLGYDVKRF